MAPVEQIVAEPKLNQAVLVAPDIDYTEFRNMLLDRLLDVAEQFTVYVNAVDKVLRFSDLLSTAAPRLGRPLDIVSDVEKMLYRRAERLVFIVPRNGEKVLGQSDSRGHSHWFENPWVSSDVTLTVNTGLTPQQRGLLRYDGRVVWDFPDD